VKAEHRRESNLLSLRIRLAEDVLTTDHELERGAPFCGNPLCALHVRLEDQHVCGGGNWVSLPDGRIFGRSRFDDRLLCDACGTHRGPVKLRPCRATS
jgi:hypothetical protein